MFSPQMGMNPLSETLHMYHMHIAGILLMVDLGPFTSFVTLTFHMFDVYGLVQGQVFS